MTKHTEELKAAGALFVLESSRNVTREIEQLSSFKIERWKSGTGERIVDFPLFDELPVNAGFSWGAKGKEVMLDANIFQELLDGKPRKAERIISSFLKIMGANSKRDETVRIFPQLKRDALTPQPEVIEILPEHLERNHERVDGVAAGAAKNILTGADFVYTRVSNVPIVVMPADCPSAVIYAKDKYGKDIVGVAHWGRDEVEHLSPAKSIGHLMGEGCKKEDIKISLTPGISQEHYYIKEEDVPGLLPDIKAWGSRAEKGFGIKNKRSWNRLESRLYLDLTGRITDQIQAFQIPRENIQFYEIDTYRAAIRGEAYSHRLAVEKGLPEMDGRFMLAAQLAN